MRNICASPGWAIRDERCQQIAVTSKPTEPSGNLQPSTSTSTSASTTTTTRNKRETMAAARRHGANSLETNPKYPMKPEFFQSSTSLGLETVSKSNSDGADRLFWFACPFNSYITCEWFPLFIQFAGQISRALFFRCPLVRIDSAHFQRTDMNWI